MRKINVLIIGAGNIAALYDTPNSDKILTHAHAFSNAEEFALVGFYDVDYKRARDAAERWGCIAFEDLDEAMKGIDVVCCCVPDQFHGKVLKEVAKYPVKLVVAEKPITRTIEEAKEVTSIYNAKRIPILINYSRRFLSEFAMLRERITSCGQFLKGVGYYGKGIQHNGSHMIDILSYLLQDVCYSATPRNIIRDYEHDDFSCDVSLQVAGGEFNMIAIDCRSATVFEMELFFEKARIRIINSGTKIEIYQVKESLDYAGYYNYVIDETIEVNYSGAMIGLVKNVRDYLKDGAALKCALEDGVNVLGVCLKIRGEM